MGPAGMDLPSLWKCHFTGNTQYPVSYPICVYAVFNTHYAVFRGYIHDLSKEYKRNEAEEILVCLLAFATLGVSGMTALILYWVYSIYWYDMVFQAGIFLYISILFWYLPQKTSRDSQFRMEQLV